MFLFDSGRFPELKIVDRTSSFCFDLLLNCVRSKANSREASSFSCIDRF